MPSVVLAAAIGGATGSFIAGTAVAGLAAVGSPAIDAFAVAFVVGVLAGFALYELDDDFGITDKLGRLYDEGLDKLGRVWKTLGTHAEARFAQLAQSYLVTDLRQETTVLAERIGHQADTIRAEITHAW